MSEKITHNNIIVVDENNEHPRAVTYDEAVANGWIRRASRVFVVNESGRVLIQRRSKHISKPLLLDNSAAGHVDEGEEYIDAALRELHEELGITAKAKDFTVLPVIQETSFFAQNYLLRVPDSVQITIDPYETAEYFWKTPAEIDTLVKDTPKLCTDSLVVVWTKLRDAIISS